MDIPGMEPMWNLRKPESHPNGPSGVYYIGEIPKQHLDKFIDQSSSSVTIVQDASMQGFSSEDVDMRRSSSEDVRLRGVPNQDVRSDLLNQDEHFLGFPNQDASMRGVQNQDVRMLRLLYQDVRVPGLPDNDVRMRKLPNQNVRMVGLPNQDLTMPELSNRYVSMSRYPNQNAVMHEFPNQDFHSHGLQNQDVSMRGLPDQDVPMHGHCNQDMGMYGFPSQNLCGIQNQNVDRHGLLSRDVRTVLCGIQNQDVSMRGLLDQDVSMCRRPNQDLQTRRFDNQTIQMRGSLSQDVRVCAPLNQDGSIRRPHNQYFGMCGLRHVRMCRHSQNAGMLGPNYQDLEMNRFPNQDLQMRGLDNKAVQMREPYNQDVGVRGVCNQNVLRDDSCRKDTELNNGVPTCSCCVSTDTLTPQDVALDFSANHPPVQPQKTAPDVPCRELLTAQNMSANKGRDLGCDGTSCSECISEGLEPTPEAQLDGLDPAAEAPLDQTGGVHLAPEAPVDLAGGLDPAPEVPLDLTRRVDTAPGTSFNLLGGVHPAPEAPLDLVDGFDPAPEAPLGLTRRVDPAPGTSLNLSGGVDPVPKILLDLVGGLDSEPDAPLDLTMVKDKETTNVRSEIIIKIDATENNLGTLDCHMDLSQKIPPDLRYLSARTANTKLTLGPSLATGTRLPSKDFEAYSVNLSPKQPDDSRPLSADVKSADCLNPSTATKSSLASRDAKTCNPSTKPNTSQVYPEHDKSNQKADVVSTLNESKTNQYPLLHWLTPQGSTSTKNQSGPMPFTPQPPHMRLVNSSPTSSAFTNPSYVTADTHDQSNFKPISGSLLSKPSPTSPDDVYPGKKIVNSNPRKTTKSGRLAHALLRPYGMSQTRQNYDKTCLSLHSAHPNSMDTVKAIHEQRIPLDCNQSSQKKTNHQNSVMLPNTRPAEATSPNTSLPSSKTPCKPAIDSNRERQSHERITATYNQRMSYKERLENILCETGLPEFAKYQIDRFFSEPPKPIKDNRLSMDEFDSKRKVMRYKNPEISWKKQIKSNINESDKDCANDTSRTPCVSRSINPDEHAQVKQEHIHVDVVSRCKNKSDNETKSVSEGISFNSLINKAVDSRTVHISNQYRTDNSLSNTDIKPRPINNASSTPGTITKECTNDSNPSNHLLLDDCHVHKQQTNQCVDSGHVVSNRTNDDAFVAIDKDNGLKQEVADVVLEAQDIKNAVKAACKHNNCSNSCTTSKVNQGKEEHELEKNTQSKLKTCGRQQMCTRNILNTTSISSAKSLRVLLQEPCKLNLNLVSSTYVRCDPDAETTPLEQYPAVEHTVGQISPLQIQSKLDVRLPIKIYTKGCADENVTSPAVNASTEEKSLMQKPSKLNIANNAYMPTKCDHGEKTTSSDQYPTADASLEQREDSSSFDISSDCITKTVNALKVFSVSPGETKSPDKRKRRLDGNVTSYTNLFYQCPRTDTLTEQRTDSSSFAVSPDCVKETANAAQVILVSPIKTEPTPKSTNKRKRPCDGKVTTCIDAKKKYSTQSPSQTKDFIVTVSKQSVNSKMLTCAVERKKDPMDSQPTVKDHLKDQIKTSGEKDLQ